MRPASADEIDLGLARLSDSAIGLPTGARSRIKPPEDPGDSHSQLSKEWPGSPTLSIRPLEPAGNHEPEPIDLARGSRRSQGAQNTAPSSGPLAPVRGIRRAVPRISAAGFDAGSVLHLRAVIRTSRSHPAITAPTGRRRAGPLLLLSRRRELRPDRDHDEDQRRDSDQGLERDHPLLEKHLTS